MAGELLREQGVEPELQEIEPGRKQTIGRLPGTGGGKSIMLNGHIDIDPLATGWTRDPFTPWIADGKLFGHGDLQHEGRRHRLHHGGAGAQAGRGARCAATWCWPAWPPS